VVTLSPASPLRQRKIERDIDPTYEAFLAGGYPLEDYPGETLQCRTELDRTNWLALKDICAEAVGAGFGDADIPEPGIRCTSNLFVRPTFAETLALMQALRTWAMAAQANWWRLKDLARSAATRESLEAIDLTQGWP
jgi:hypothetical protein